MLKKILCIAMALLMVLALATSCKKKPKKNTSSKKPTTSEVVSDVNVESSEIADIESGNDDESFPYRWTMKTKSNFFRDTDEAKTSATGSESVKKYKYDGNVLIGSFHFNTVFTTHYGTDNDSRLQEFADVVNEGYFNTYIITLSSRILSEAKIIAEAGGTIWLSAGCYESKSTDINSYIDNIAYYVELLKNNGYGDILLGFTWDEPVWRTQLGPGNGMNNEDYLACTKALYQKFGLRTFPVLATSEFTKFEGNALNITNLQADEAYQMLPDSLKYTTDVGFDSYAIDVRDGASNGSAIANNAKLIPTIKDGKTYYSETMKYLTNYAKHDVNVWYFPTAYTCSLWGGLNGLNRADEDYCIAHLEYMSQDILKQPHPGGLIIYSYNHGENTTSSVEKSFAQFCTVKDASGNYKLFKTTAKWSKYSTKLKEVRALFDTKKANLSTYKPN